MNTTVLIKSKFTKFPIQAEFSDEQPIAPIYQFVRTVLGLSEEQSFSIYKGKTKLDPTNFNKRFGGYKIKQNGELILK